LVVLYDLVRARHRRGGLPLETRFPTPPIGREETLRELSAKLDLLLSGQGQVIRLVGEAGMGKSHLASDFVRKAKNKGVNVVVGNCQSVTQTAAYTPWRQIFFALLNLDEGSETGAIEKLTTFLETEHSGWVLRLPLLGDLLGLPIPDNPTTGALDSNLRQVSLFSLLVEMVQAWALEKPLILLVDNSQWMDEAFSGANAGFSQQVSGGFPVMVFLAHRPVMFETETLLPKLNNLSNYAEIFLKEMPEGDISLLAERILGAAPSQLVSMIVQQMTRGNPFFVSELLNAMLQGGQLAKDIEEKWHVSDDLLAILQRSNFVLQVEGEWLLRSDVDLSSMKIGIPDSIHGLILARLDRFRKHTNLRLKLVVLLVIPLILRWLPKRIQIKRLFLMSR
ncbi:MAG: AAA family ATPase, partial [Anaerolineae bacterium]|nr:AAA family ATPase [Anaerolineae bacterium]